MAELVDEHVPETGSEVSVSTEESTADKSTATTLSTSIGVPPAGSSAMEVDQPGNQQPEPIQLDTAPQSDPPQPDAGQPDHPQPDIVAPPQEPLQPVEYAISQVVGDDVEGTDVVATEDVRSTTEAKPDSDATSEQQGIPFRKSVVAFAQHYSVANAAERFKVPVSSVKKWMKAENVSLKPKFNSPGQGRKITYSSETDQAIAEHIKGMIASGEKVSVQQICTYAKAKIREENPQFNASTGWAQRFLIRHGIDLTSSRGRKSKKEETRPTSDIRGRPLSYSSATDNAIADYVRSRQAEGSSLSNSELRKYAKELVSKENPNFTGSASWAQNFLLRHKISLHTAHSDVDSLTHQSKSGASLSHDSAMSTSSAAGSMQYTDPNQVGSLECVVDESIKTALAILAGENFDATLLTPAQAAALQSLAELTSDNVSLIDLLTNAQQLQVPEQQAPDGSSALIAQHGMDSSNSGIYLGMSTSESFGSAFSGPGATQVDPNTQTPVLPQISSIRGAGEPQASSPQLSEQEVVQASRPLSYTRETDQQLANWVHSQQAAGKKVTFASLRAYAKKLVSNENPHFNASIGWVTPFLLRHNLDLSLNKKKKQPRKGSTPRKISSEDSEEKLFEEGDSINASDEGDVNDPLAALSQSEVIVAKAPVVNATSIAQVLVTQAFAKQALVESSQIAKGTPIVLSTIPQPSEQPHGDPATESVTVLVTDPAAGTEQTLSPASADEKKPITLKRRQSIRSRHTLSEKLEVVRLMREYNIAAHHVCRMLGLANSTLAGWIKLVQVKGPELEVLSTNRKRANVSGQGRPLSYSKDKDDIIAHWVRTQQELGIQIASADLAKYATSVISQENPNFTASSGWQQKFLQRNNLQLVTNWQLKAAADSGVAIGESNTTVVEDQQSIPAAVQTEEVVTHDACNTSLMEKPYSDEIEANLVDWAKEKITTNGSLSVQVLCRQAEEVVIDHNPSFIATLGWAFKFLHRNSIFLDPKPATPYATDGSRKRASIESSPNFHSTPKKLRSVAVPEVTVSPSTGNLCEALLALSSQPSTGSTEQTSENTESIQAAVEAVQSAMQMAIQQVQKEVGDSPSTLTPIKESLSASQSTYFGKPAREFSTEEKEEVVRFANATTLQKAALKYGVAAPTVWRWRVELKLHQPKYTSMQKKYIIKFAETNSLKEAAQRYGITSKTIQNWRKALQTDGELSSLSAGDDPISQMTGDLMEPPGESSTSGGAEQASDVVTYDNQNFQFIVDGGEVMDTLGAGREQSSGADGGGTGTSSARMDPLEVTNEVDIENVGMEYDVVSSEGHAAKPRCTQEEKLSILQYALEHSVKDASVKFGISPGTLYYWKKSMQNPSSSLTVRSTQLTSGVVSSSADVSLSLPTSQTSTSATADTVMSVQFAGMSGEGSVNVLQDLVPPTTSDGTSVADQLLSNETAPVTLNTITSETLQSLPPDINFLQAVSSLLSTAETNLTPDARKEKADTPHDRHGSVSGGISSPTEVLVAPFKTPTSSSTATQTTSSSAATAAASSSSPSSSSTAQLTAAADTSSSQAEAASSSSDVVDIVSGGEIMTTDPVIESSEPMDTDDAPSSSDALQPVLDSSAPAQEVPEVVADVSETVELSDATNAAADSVPTASQ